MEEQQCKICGCTEKRACKGGCHWIEYDLCSSCIVKIPIIGTVNSKTGKVSYPHSQH